MRNRKRMALLMTAVWLAVCCGAVADGSTWTAGSGYTMMELHGVMPVSWSTQEAGEDVAALLDGNTGTVYQHVCWNDRAMDSIPEITFYFNGATLRELWICNGNQASESAYYANARIKRLNVTVVMADGSSVTNHYQLQDRYMPNDVSDGWILGHQRVTLPQTFRNVMRVELGIQGWYMGNTKQYVIHVADIVFTSDDYTGMSYVPGPATAQPGGGYRGGYGSGSYAGTGILVTLNQRMATRSGPGTQYTELGSYFQAGTAVTAVSAAYDDRNGIWWIQTEFTYNGEKRRAYTGLKRLNMSVGDVPTEYMLADDAVLNRSVYAYMGPGYGYAMYHLQIPAGTTGKVWLSEGGYAQFEFYDYTEGAWRRVWVQESALEGTNG